MNKITQNKRANKVKTPKNPQGKSKWRKLIRATFSKRILKTLRWKSAGCFPGLDKRLKKQQRIKRMATYGPLPKITKVVKWMEKIQKSRAGVEYTTYKRMMNLGKIDSKSKDEAQQSKSKHGKAVASVRQRSRQKV